MLTKLKRWKILTHADFLEGDVYISLWKYIYPNSISFMQLWSQGKISFSLPWWNNRTFPIYIRFFIFASFNDLGFCLGDFYLILMMMWEYHRTIYPIFHFVQHNILLWLVPKSNTFIVNEKYASLGTCSEPETFT